jgi:hypothetical protein
MAIGYTRNAFSTQCAAGDRRVKKSLSRIYMQMIIIIYNVAIFDNGAT